MVTYDTNYIPSGSCDFFNSSFNALISPLRSWFPTLISCSPNLPSVYIRLCKHGNHFTFLHDKLFGATAEYPATLVHLICMCREALKIEA